MHEQYRKIRHIKVRNQHTPTLRFARYDFHTASQTTIIPDERTAFRRSATDVVEAEGGGWLDDIASESGGEAVGPRHEPIAQVVDVACRAPPAGDEQFGTRRGGDVFEMFDARVLWIRAEAVLLVVAGAEDVVAYSLNSEDACTAKDAQAHWVNGEIARLQAVCEGNPDEVAECKHEPEAVLDDVHCGEDGGFVVEGVEDVDCLTESRNDHAIGDVAVVVVLAE